MAKKANTATNDTPATFTLDAVSLQTLIAEASAKAVSQALAQMNASEVTADTKTKKTDAKSDAITKALDECKDMTLAQVIARIAPIGKANKKAGKQVKDERAEELTSDTLKYYPVQWRACFKRAWKKAKKAGTIRTRAQALTMLEKAM